MTRRRHLTTVLLLLSAGAVTACGVEATTVPGEEVSVAPDSLGSHPEVRFVEVDEADLVLHVSNQSFDDETVHLEVAVDGVRVVKRDFAVEGQHTWVTFALALPPGRHEVSARSDSGARLRETFRTREGEPRYALIDHWGEEGSAELDWRVQREPMAFQ